MDPSNSGIANADEDLWLVEFSGTRYVCDTCPRPRADVASPAGNYVTLMVRRSTLESVGDQITARPVNLASFGDVESLRD
jgi:hypothetical protein